MAVPLMNWLCVHTEAMVVISLIVTLAGALLPSTVIRAMAGLLPAALLAAGVPPWATR
jgi:cadmium resistance protein CadD (predicted permease)